MPKELICPQAGQVAWRQYEDRPLQPDEIRIRAQFGAEKHGTMGAFVKGYANQRGRLDRELNLFMPGGMLWSYPIPLGNMVVGTVGEVGSAVTSMRVGDRVLYYSSFRPTAVTKPAWVWTIPEELPWETAVCVDPAEFALCAVRDGNVRVGDVVAVFGLGAIGLMAVQLARVAGATVYAIDPVEARRQQATRFGAAGTFSGSEDVGLELRKLTGGRGVDVAIDFAGAMPAMQAALRCVAFGGTVVAGAFPGPYPAGLDLGAEAHHNRPNLVFSRACSDPSRDHPRWNERRLMETCLELMKQGKLDGRGVVGPVVEFGDLVDQYMKVALDPLAGVKLGVRWG